MPALVVLIGPMASGKTKIGKRVARALNASRLDTDSMFVSEHGPIADFFAKVGEADFRRLEAEYVAQALESDAVVSLGGGAVLDAGSQALLEAAHVVSLSVSPEAVESRLGDGKRPLVADGIESWTRIYAQRRPIYERLADRNYDTSSTSLDDIAQDISEWVLSGYNAEQKVGK